MKGSQEKLFLLFAYVRYFHKNNIIEIKCALRVKKRRDRDGEKEQYINENFFIEKAKLILPLGIRWNEKRGGALRRAEEKFEQFQKLID